MPGLKYLKLLCEQIPEIEVVKAFNSSEKFLNEMDSLDFDICILDVEMPGINGISVANLLGGRPVIFTTAYKEYAADAFDLDAIDYLQKPIKKERLQIAVNKAIKRLKNSVKNFIQLNTDKGKTLLFFDQLTYIQVNETDSRDKTVLLNNGKRLVIKNISFEKLLQFLPEKEFCQVNKKEVISLRCVQFFAYDEITTNIIQLSGKPLVLTLGDSFRASFLKKVKV